MTQKKKRLELPVFHLAGEFDLAKAEGDGRVPVRWYSGETVDRFSIFEGPYKLRFDMSASAVDLRRARMGAPVKKGHAMPDDLDAQVGVLEDVTIKDGEGFAMVRFANDAESQAVRQKVVDRIYRNVSMEAKVVDLQDVTPKGATVKEFVARSWELFGLAIVSSQADRGAQFLGANAQKYDCVLSGADASGSGEGNVKIQVKLKATGATVEILESEFDANLHEKLAPPSPTPAAPAAPSSTDPVQQLSAAQRFVDQTIAAEKLRAERLKTLGAFFGCDPGFVQNSIDQGATEEQFATLAQKYRAEHAHTHVDPTRGDNAHLQVAWKVERMAEAVFARARGKEVPEKARPYASKSLVELAHECLGFVGQGAYADPRGDRLGLFKLALGRTDFPNLLENISNKMLLADYEQALPTYRRLAERIDLADFKTASILKVGDFPQLLELGENAEIQLGSFSEAKDTYALASYARALAISFQMLVNDDLGAINRVMGAGGRRVADFENALWFTLLQSASGVGPTLGDTGALFNATAVTTAGGHANYVSSGTAIDVTSLGVARAAMKKQVSLDGLKLNIRPRFLLVTPDKETIAEQYTTQITPALGSSVNPFAGKLETLSDANITSSTAWYLFADPAVAPVSAYGYLQGQAGPRVRVQPGWKTLGVEVALDEHFGTCFFDFRGVYKNNGA